jgi:hypothetical protein
MYIDATEVAVNQVSLEQRWVLLAEIVIDDRAGIRANQS